jgi:3',5'-cyclic AMP phosphodiesterase CpdA
MNHSLDFLVIGDWGRRGLWGQQETANQMAATAEVIHPQFIISTGDNFYDAGVEDLADSHWIESFESVYNQESLQIPWYIAVGNHDYGGSIRAQIDYSLISNRWNFPSHYYTFSHFLDQEEVLFVVTDTTPFISECYSEERPEIFAQDRYQQLAWLENELARSSAKWKVVVGHHPAYSSSPFHGNADELIDAFVPLFKRYHVDLYLSGHEHDLQLQKPLGTTNYLVSGAGSEIRETGSYDITRFSTSSNGFVHIRLGDDQLAICFIDSQGKQLFKKRIVKEAVL